MRIVGEEQPYPGPQKLQLRIVGEDEPYPGPLWEPIIWDGRYPSTGGDTGDIYINRYREPPLYYVFFAAGNSQPVQREEIAEWVTGGLMSLSQPDPPKGHIGQSDSKTASWAKQSTSHLGVD